MFSQSLNGFALWADTAAPAASTYHQFARLHSLSEWWQWLALLVICVAVVAYVTVLYRRDTVEMRGGVAWSLLLLRLAAFGGILFFYLDLERRTEHKLVKNSRVHLLVDTSQSMGLQDQDARGTATKSRIELVTAELANGDLIKQLRAHHDVVAYRFDQQAKPVEIASFPKIPAASKADQTSAASAAVSAAARSARWTALVAGALLALAAVTGAWSWLANRKPKPRTSGEQTSYGLLVSMVSLIAALVVFAVATLRTPDLNLLVTLGLREPAAASPDSPANRRSTNEPETEPEPVDWFAQLTPRGAETRIGDAVEYLVNRERGGPVAGIVLFTDGGQNAGQQYQVAIAAAQDAGIPIYTVGLGSDRRPQNVRVVDIEAPQRVYPGDRFTVTGLLQAFGMDGRTVKVELLSGAASANDKEKSADTFEEERRVKLGSDGEVVPLKFEVEPTETGRRLYKVRVTLPEPDYDPRDNEKTATVQVVERKNRVLLLAGGPSREFQFLRNMLFRDKETTVDVLLQSGVPGISQEAHDVLFEFPKTADELFEYDCIVGFDPDWEALTDEHVRLLDRWVAEQAGGLIVLAGPVYTPLWSGRRNDERIDTIKALYPVVFYQRGAATLSMGRFGGDRPWPLQFTRDGLDAEFLWLGESASASEQTWSSFEGVYGYYAVKDPKSGARIYTRFSDPDTALENEQPIYMAGHFYGAGRVFFQASGEMWRVRAVDDSSFDQFYTKLIRWASQGRLLRDSSRGVLLVDKDRCLLGDHIAVRAILADAQRRPLTDDEVPAQIVQPDGIRVPLKLRKVKDAARDGMYAAQFTAMQEGDYRVELRSPHSPEDELLTCEVRARVPALEIEKPERNDALLTEIAEKTGGHYFIGIDSVANRAGGGRSLAGQLEPQDQETILPGKPDHRFQRLLMTWLMALICGVLSVEWLIRRLSKLA